MKIGEHLTHNETQKLGQFQHDRISGCMVNIDTPINIYPYNVYTHCVRFLNNSNNSQQIQKKIGEHLTHNETQNMGQFQHDRLIRLYMNFDIHFTFYWTKSINLSHIYEHMCYCFKHWYFYPGNQAVYEL